MRALYLAPGLATLVLAGCAAPPGASPVPRTHLPAAPPPAEPPVYLGLSAARLSAALGKPAFVREDGMTALWRYDGAGCRAFFFLLKKEGAASVSHVETLPRGKAAAADPKCLASLTSAKRS
jgi:hypothetical protein